MSFFLLDHLCPTMLAHPSARLALSKAELGQAQIMAKSGLRSGINDPNTAAVFAEMLGIPVESDRHVAVLNYHDTALIGIYRGPRSTVDGSMLPGGVIDWFHLKVLSPAAHT